MSEFQKKRGRVKHVSFNTLQVILEMEDGTEQMLLFPSAQNLPAVGDLIVDTMISRDLIDEI